MKRILVTGCAGFIGSHLCEKLLHLNYLVVGIDNFDAFYSKEIKIKNLSGFITHKNFTFHELDLTFPTELQSLSVNVDAVIHLAGKAGVRPSINNPLAYINHNIIATQTVLDFMRNSGCNKLIFASSSSVYGNCKSTPFKEDMNVDYPISPYAASKKSAELFNYTYHHLYKIDIVNLRFFTVYGERQRPDLAIHKFIKDIINNKPITMFGDGSTARDYTYISDTVAGIVAALGYIFSANNVYEIVNLGNNTPIQLSTLIETIENVLNKKAIIEHLPMQQGDVDITYASIEKAQQLFNYQPKTALKEGLTNFVDWIKEESI